MSVLFSKSTWWFRCWRHTNRRISLNQSRPKKILLANCLVLFTWTCPNLQANLHISLHFFKRNLFPLFIKLVSMEQSANLFFFTWLGSNFWLVIQLKGEFPVKQSSRPMIQIFLFCQCRKECTCTDQLLSERLGFFLFSPTSKEPTFPFLHSKVGTRWCQLLSLGQCCHWPFRPKNGNNKFKVSTKSCCTVNHLLEMSYDLCQCSVSLKKWKIDTWYNL